MLSLCIFIGLLIGSFALNSLVIARTARWAGSARGRFGVGVLVVLGLSLMNVIVAVASEVALKSGLSPIAVMLLGFAVQLALTFALIRHAFRLSDRKALAPFGATIGMAVLALVLAMVVVRLFVVEAFHMPTASMTPTIQADDRFTANKLLKPRRWDVVAFRHPAEGGGTTIHCKRLVGLPGDRLRFEEGQVYVNDQLQSPPAVVTGRYKLSLANGSRYGMRYEEGETIELGPDEIFLVGDQMDISNDSRLEGPSKWTDIIGVADLRYWPVRRVAILR